MTEFGGGPKFPKRLLIFGASVRHAAELAAARGIRVVAVDLFADRETRCVAECFRISQFDEIVKILPEINADQWIYTGGIENRPNLIEIISKKIPLCGCHAKAAVATRQAARLFEIVADHGFLVPQFMPASELDDVSKSANWVAKKNKSVGGAGVSFVAKDSTSSEFDYVQKKITGQSLSAIFVSNVHDCLLVAVTRQLTAWNELGAREFQYCGSVGPVELDPANADIVANLGKLLAAKLEIQGLFGIDFILNEHGPWFLEINPRFTASIETVSRFASQNIMQMHLDACLGIQNLVGGVTVTNEKVAKVILFNRSPVQIDVCQHRWAQCKTVLAELNHPGIEFAMTDTSADQESIAPRRPICTLKCCFSKSIADIDRELILAADAIYQQLEQPDFNDSIVEKRGGAQPA